MTERLLTPSKITAWLDCAHYLTLRDEVDRGVRPQPPVMVGEMARMLMDKGLWHEQAVVDRYRAEGRTVLEVPERAQGESFTRWTARVAPLLDGEHDVIYQMPFVHNGIRGVADFLERVIDRDGRTSYEPVDAKLARGAAKPGHVLQLCFYAEAVAASLGRAPERVHIELGSGARETIRIDDVAPYWRRLRSQLAAIVAGPPTEATAPEPCDHCAFCEFEQVCDAEWRAADSLIHVAGIRRSDRALLDDDGVAAIAALATLAHEVEGLDPQRRDRLARQARLQVLAREAPDSDPPPFELISASPEEDEPVSEGASTPSLTGFAALPEPDDGDVFLDFEGHPFWRADVGLFFLFGLIERDGDEWAYKTFWAHTQAEEAQATKDLVDHLVERRRRYPGMHVYHYNHTERSALSALAAQYAVAELDLEELVATGAFVDLYPVVTGAVQVGTESYGLKHVERLADYQRSHDIDRGSGAVIEYEHWMHDHDEARLQRIARYNDDDVRATRAVRDWLVAHRPEDLPWRDTVLEPPVDESGLDERIERLHAFGPGTHEHLMGDLLGYWRRERRVVAADCLRLSMADQHDQLASPSVIARLQFHGLRDRVSARTGRKLKGQAAQFSFPDQPIDPDITPGSTMIVALQEQEWSFLRVEALDREDRTITVTADDHVAIDGLIPDHLVHWVAFDESAKLAALSELADRMLDNDASAVGHKILRRDPSVFVPGEGPADGLFSGGYQQACAWAPHLDHSYVPIQGPPGTGKTFTGAHIVHTLVQQGRRVGLTAMSHHAIDNLTQAVVDRFAEEGTPLSAARKAAGGPVTGVDYINDNTKCATGGYDVVAGTSWLFASRAMRDNPVDVLIVDEAGQLALADTIAASISATDVILLGDPQQLPQVAQAAHPDRSGVSALDHLIGEGARTFPPDRGLLLDTTWRMHPDVCGFISDVMYEGRLTSEAGCARQGTDAGTGLRWIRAEHMGRSTESPEEAATVAATIRDLVGTRWTDREGATRPITVDDIIVVAPYNDQRRLLTRVLAADPVTAGVEVGTVDKFQGREATVVIFSMATSSAEFMPRDASFLFSKNRLNVAISRARCLAYLVCTDELLDTRPRDVEQMRLVSALCAFVERAEIASTAAAVVPASIDRDSARGSGEQLGRIRR
ncbi:TM0106 family RecB-like putative nuclease [Isoptericola sp. b441]|uniref:TM0106 family RecB-like putative nuclease n=1 Tax=Actinotalea lenta TaxID=3064654 RepID=A0ABT9DDK4_9CELL|nr:TM0106 family RecB-like putative nuclease [Isoptericola sp. b441]MDO8108338.1 TM0106 family RecB-like putative nuclease [Isoptericola sp. b441]